MDLAVDDNSRQVDQILYEARPPMFRNNPVAFLIMVALIPMYGVGLFLLLVWFLKSYFNVLTVSREEVLHSKGILSKERSQFNRSSIRSVRIKQSMFQRIFGTGNIEIVTAGDLPEITIYGMPRPHKLRQVLISK